MSKKSVNRQNIVTLEYANPIDTENENSTIKPKNRQRDATVPINEVLYNTLPQTVKDEYEQKLSKEAEEKDEETRNVLLLAGGLLIGGAVLYFTRNFIKSAYKNNLMKEVSDTMIDNANEILKK
jgi:hypothetical protein